MQPPNDYNRLSARSRAIDSRRMPMLGRTIGFVNFLYLLAGLCIASDSASTDGWTQVAPREEIKPMFRYEPTGGRDGKPVLVIAGDQREGTSGWWQKKFEVEGGKTYRFTAWRRVEGVESPRHSGLARVLWRDA